MVIDREAAVYRIARSSRAMTTLDVVTPLLQLSQQDIAAGDLDLAGRRLEIELLDHAVIDQHRIALGADAQPVAGSVELHADRLGEFGFPVGGEGALIALVGARFPPVLKEAALAGKVRDRFPALSFES